MVDDIFIRGKDLAAQTDTDCGPGWYINQAKQEPQEPHVVLVDTIRAINLLPLETQKRVAGAIAVYFGVR